MDTPFSIRGITALAAGLLTFPSTPALAQGLVSERALSQVGFAPYWQARLPFQRGDTALAAYLLDGTLYVTTRMGELHVVDAAVGVPQWTRRVTDVGRTLRRPSHLTTADGRAAVLVTHGGGANVYDRASGDALAEVRGLWPQGGPAVGDALMLYVGSSDGHLYAVRWYDPEHKKPIVRWRVLGGGPVTSAPTLYSNVLYFSSQSGKVFACTADRRKSLVWQFATEGPLEADAVVDGDSVYVAGLDRSLYAVDRESGALKWRFRIPGPLRDAPVVTQGAVYQFCSQSGLWAVEADTGKPMWSMPDGLALASRGADRACVVLAGDRIAVAENNTGVVMGTLQFERSVLVPVHRGAIPLYAVTLDGDAACYAPRDMPFLRGEELNRRRPGAPATQPSTQPAEGETPAEPPKPASEESADDPFRSRFDRP